MIPVDQINVGSGPLQMGQVAEGQQPAQMNQVAEGEQPVQANPVAEGEQPAQANPVAEGEQPVAGGVAQQDEPPRALESLDGRHRITASMFKEGDVAQAVEASKGSTLKRVLLGIFTFGIYTAVKHCSRKNLASDVVNLKNQLKTFNPGENRTVDVRIGGETVTLEQREDGVFTAKIDGEWYKVPYTAGQLVDRLERDIVTHPDLYGKRAACEVLPDVGLQNADDINALFETGADQAVASPDNARLRSLSLAVLSSRFGIDETKTFAISTKLLNHYAHQVLCGNVTNKARLESALARVAAGVSYLTNSQSDLDVILNYESAMKSDRAQVNRAVNMPSTQLNKALIFSQDQASKQQLVHNFVADLVSSSRSWEADLLQKHPGERLRSVLKENAAIIAAMIGDRTLLNTLPEPLRDVMNPALDRIKEKLDEAQGQAGIFARFLNNGAARTGAIAAGIKEMPDEELIRMETEITVSVFNASLVTQEEFNRLLEEELAEEPANANAPAQGQQPVQGEEPVQGGEPVEGEQPVQGEQPAQAEQHVQGEEPLQAEQPVAQEGAPVQGEEPVQGGEPVEGEEPVQGAEPAQAEGAQQAEKPKKPKKPTLDDFLNGGGTNGNYFKFMKQVLKTYFATAPVEDQRAMFAACIRYSTEDSSPAEKLGALLKGAGPIMQKMLQGFNTTGVSAELRSALQDMKSNLAPIHEDVVRAHLLNMVEASHGKITKIDVVEILGAASVGQVMSCKMHMADGTEKDCVVKIRRPDVLARAQREKEVFEKAAKEVPGMEVTFAGQLDRIMAEMDLSIEAKNVKAGQIYGQTEYDNVASMKLFSDIEPTPSTLVLEKAPGTTVDKYLSQVGEEVDELLHAAVQHDENGNLLRDEDGNLVPDPLKVEENYTAVLRLGQIYESLLDRQRHIANLSKVWVEEGIFKEGFYHGDLHAGNIMVDDKTATFIDFGNATKLTEEQQKHVMIMMLAAGSSQSGMFADSYRALLSKDGKARFDAMKREIKPFLEDILSRGTKEQTGKRIAAALKGLQDMGLELPAPIFNFSQCQQRLEGTVDGINALTRKVEQALQRLQKPDDDYSLDSHILKIAFRGGTDPLRNGKEDLVDDHDEHTFRWYVEEYSFRTKYSYKSTLYPVLPQALKEKYTPDVMFPNCEGVNEMLSNNPDEAKTAEFWQDVEAYIEQTRQNFMQLTRRLTDQNLVEHGLEPGSWQAMFPDNSFHTEKEELPDFFTLMTTVISGYLDSGLKRAAFAMKIGVMNSWRLGA